MEITANPVNVEQLVALIEARQFPIGLDFTDPLAQRLYDAMSVLMCHASIYGRQASIARRYIATRAEMEISQGGYNSLKRCMEEMNAQALEAEGNKATVVLCQRYSEELSDLLSHFHPVEVIDDLRCVADLMGRLQGLVNHLARNIPAGESPDLTIDITAIRKGADLLEGLMGYLPVAALAATRGDL
ncbi:hypothetical protein [Aeromonas veronii]|uniref:hypothetical protein n=1 Tax=Aeromonas veronii TaxID=654 RepID=UPI003D1C4F70